MINKTLRFHKLLTSRIVAGNIKLKIILISITIILPVFSLSLVFLNVVGSQLLAIIVALWIILPLYIQNLYQSLSDLYKNFMFLPFSSRFLIRNIFLAQIIYPVFYYALIASIFVFILNLINKFEGGSIGIGIGFSISESKLLIAFVLILIMANSVCAFIIFLKRKVAKVYIGIGMFAVFVTFLKIINSFYSVPVRFPNGIREFSERFVSLPYANYIFAGIAALTILAVILSYFGARKLYVRQRQFHSSKVKGREIA
jgi:hypothetical protein